MIRSPVLALAAILLVTGAFAGCDADRVAFSSCSGAGCCDGTCGLHAPALEPIPDGALLFADVAAPAIYRLAPAGGFERLAGTGEAGSSPDGVPARAAAIGPPILLGTDPADGGLVFREISTGAVRKIDAQGLLVTLGRPAR